MMMNDSKKMDALVSWIERACMNEKHRKMWQEASLDMIPDPNSVCSDRILVCKSPLKKYHRLPIPLNCILTEDVVSSSAVGQVFSNLDRYTLFAMFIIGEQRKGSASYWAHYIDILPRDIKFHPITFHSRLETTIDLKEEVAKHELLARALEAQREKLKSEFNQVLFLLQSEKQGLVPLLTNNPPSMDEFLWASCMIISRAFELENPNLMCMLPFVDSMNHASVHTTVQLRPKLVQNHFIVTISQNLDENSELTFNYHGSAGAASRLDELKEYVMYGFSERGTFKEVSRLLMI